MDRFPSLSASSLSEECPPAWELILVVNRAPSWSHSIFVWFPCCSRRTKDPSAGPFHIPRQWIVGDETHELLVVGQGQKLRQSRPALEFRCSSLRGSFRGVHDEDVFVVGKLSTVVACGLFNDGDGVPDQCLLVQLPSPPNAYRWDFHRLKMNVMDANFNRRVTRWSKLSA